MPDDLQEPGGEPERPDWLPDRWSNPEEMVKSYSEMESAWTRQQQQLRGMEQAQAELYDQLQEMQELSQQSAASSQPAMPAGADQFSPLVSMLEQARDSGDIRTELQIQAALQRSLYDSWQQEQQAQYGRQEDPNSPVVNQLFAEATERLVRQQLPDWDEIKEGVHDTIERHPYLLTDTNQPVEAANMVRNAAAIYRQEAAERAAQGGNPYEPQRQAKQQAQTMQGQGLHPGTEQTPEQEWETIRNAPLERFKL